MTNEMREVVGRNNQEHCVGSCIMVHMNAFFGGVCATLV